VYSGPGVEGFDTHLAADIRQHVHEALARFGAVGQVTLEGDILVLVSPAGRFTTPLGASGRDWWRMAPDERRRAALELARRLNDQRRSAVPTATAPPNARPYVLAGLLLLVLGASIAAYPFLVRPEAPSSTPPAESADPGADARSQQACEEARARVLRGGTLGPLDVDGWVVEIALIRSGDTLELTRDPGLRAFVDDPSLQPRLVWRGSPELSSLTGPTTALAVQERTYPPRGKPEWRELNLTFSGRFVDRYFREAERPAYFELADALTTRLAVPYAAVYARCAHRPADAMVGAWIRGPGVSGAAGALVFFMDVRSAASHVEPLAAPAPRGSPELLPHLAEVATVLDRRGLAALLANTSGMVAGSEEGAVTVMFPFKDFSRPSRAALQVARQIDVAR
jgi:hypothetical protein